MSEMNCWNCGYGQRIGDGIECRENNFVYLFPDVIRDMRCGKWIEIDEESD